MINLIDKEQMSRKYKNKGNEKYYLDDVFSRRDLSEKTRYDYSCAQNQFHDWLGDDVPTREKVIEWLTVKRNQGTKNKSLGFYRSALNIIIKDCEMEVITNDDFVIKKSKDDLEPKDILTLDEIKNLRKVTPYIRYQRQPGEIKLLTELYLSSGLRKNEALSITYDCFDLEKLECTVRNGKGGKSRTTAISKQFRDDLIKYRGNLIKTNLKVFKISGKHYGKLLKTAARIAGIKKEIWIHLLRHTFATYHYKFDETHNLLKLAKLLGHDDINMCLVYTHLSGEDIKTTSPMDLI